AAFTLAEPGTCASHGEAVSRVVKLRPESSPSRKKTMNFKALAAAAVLALGAVTMAGCNQEKQAVVTYDMSTASNQKYLADNALKEGVKRLPSGLQYRVIKAGTGKRVTSAGDMVTVTYKGQLINGKVF